MKKMGFNFRIAHSFKQMLADAGFVDIVEERLEVPWGAWPKDRRRKAIGLWHLGLYLRTCDCRSNANPVAEQLKQGLQGIVMGLFTRSLGWTQTEVEIFLVELRKQLDDKNYQLLDHASVFAFSPYREFMLIRIIATWSTAGNRNEWCKLI
jgi:hypothetical protein